MANWSLPTLTSTYTNFLTEVTGRDTDVALGLDPATTTVTNPPTNAIRWNSANNRWEKWSGTVWNTLSATYAFTAVTTTGNASVGGTLTVTGATTLAAATATTPATGATGTEVATAAWVNAQGFAKLASPTFTGTPAAPTAAANTNTTQVATTAFVIGQAASTNPVMDGTAAVGTGTTFARADHRHPTDTTRAPLASPSFTGIVTFGGDVNNNSTGYLELPVGTTAQRPTTPASGMVRYNSDSGEFEGYGTEWAQIGGSVPTGTVIYVASNTPPSGYIAADGAAISRTAYVKLFTAIGTTFGAGDGSTTFNVPDLRGEFIRGWSNGSTVDSGRLFGSAQADDFKSHSHTVNDPGHAHTFYMGTTTAPSGGIMQPGVARGIGNYASFNMSMNASGTGITINANGGAETRPRNIALLACIKF